MEKNTGKTKPTITVFTPTYNRADLLPQCYEALKRQTSDDFLWMIIDDGSTDNTEEVAKEWLKEDNKFEIQYIKKENGGLHTGYNTAIANADTELMMCIDSDDFPPDDCVQKVVAFWEKNKDEKYAGIIGLDFDLEGNRLGDKLPEQKSVSLVDMAIGKYKIKKADRKLVIRTDLYKEVAPMPSFPGEKNFNPHYMHLKIGMKREFLVLNECLCCVEYQPQGMSAGIYKQYYNSPNSFAEIRLLDLSLPGSLLYKYKKSIHYCSSCILAHREHYIRKSPCKIITALAILPGMLFTKIVERKNA